MSRRFLATAPVAFVGVVLLAGGTGCEPPTPPDGFDPSGVYRGPGALVGTITGAPVSIAEDDTVMLDDEVFTLGTSCTLQLKESVQVNVQDNTYLRELASVRTPTFGQMCTLETTSGAISFRLTDGTVTIWRADVQGLMDVSFTGTTNDGSVVAYTFSGYK